MLASFARESPHSASFTARRGSRTTGTRCAASANRPVQKTVSNTSAPTAIPYDSTFSMTTTSGSPPVRSARTRTSLAVIPNALRAVAVEAQPGGLGSAGVDGEDARHAAFSFVQAWRVRQARNATQSRAVTSASYSRVPPSVTWTMP